MILLKTSNFWHNGINKYIQQEEKNEFIILLQKEKRSAYLF